MSDILCDSGANISIISEHLMPKKPKFCSYVAVGSVGDHTNTYRTILVPTVLFGRTVKLFVAVAPRSHLPADVILGRNIPGLIITWSVGDVSVSTSQKKEKLIEEVSKGSSNHSGDNPVGVPARETPVKKKNKSVSLDTPTIIEEEVMSDPDEGVVSDPDSIPDTEAEEKSVEVLQKSSRRRKKFAAQNLQLNQPARKHQLGSIHSSTNLEILNLSNPKVAKVMAVQTRAQKLKAEQQKKEDDEATARSGARVWMPEHSQEEEEEDELQEELSQRRQTSSEESAGNEKADLPTQLGEEESVQLLSGTNPEEIIIIRDMLIKGQLDDDTLHGLTQETEEATSSYYLKDNILYKKRFNADESDKEEDEGRGIKDEDGLIVVPDSLKTTIMRAGHDLAGHFGVKKTKKMIAQHFYWKRMGSDIAHFCKSCPQCQAYSNSPDKRPPLKPLPVITEPWERLAMDIVGPLPRTPTGNRFILTLMDFGTRFPEAIPLKNTDAKTTCNALMKAFSFKPVPIS